MIKPIWITVRAKGQITLPAPIVKAARLTEGQHLRVEYQHDQDVLILTPVGTVSRKVVR